MTETGCERGGFVAKPSRLLTYQGGGRERRGRKIAKRKENQILEVAGGSKLKRRSEKIKKKYKKSAKN